DVWYHVHDSSASAGRFFRLLVFRPGLRPADRGTEGSPLHANHVARVHPANAAGPPAARREIRGEQPCRPDLAEPDDQVAHGSRRGSNQPYRFERAVDVDALLVELFDVFLPG